MDERIYIPLKDNVFGISKENWDLLPVDENGVKKAIGMPNGTQLEIIDFASGTIGDFAEAVLGLWCLY